jgi:hypothetical protein
LRIALILSICPSDSGWNAVLRFLEVPIASITFFQNWEVNKDPQSDIMLLGSPWACTTCMRNPSASALGPMVSLHATKCAILVR